jgi:tetratricopeptide (TPR) repeat protein
MAFFERFRADVRRYAEGVHDFGPPLGEAALRRAETRLGRRLPPGFGDFYRSWDGVRLFADSFVLRPAAELEADARGRLVVGEALGAPIVVDEAGRLYELDESGDAIVVGSTLERWLAAVLSREALVVDREGEWRDVFDGGELGDEVRRRRARAGLKADPDAAAWHLEQAELAFEAGDEAAAADALERAVAKDPQAAAACVLLGGLHHRSGRLEAAEQAFVAAASSSGDPSRRAERLAEAARAAGEAGQKEARAAHAGAALAVEPHLAGRLTQAAAARLEADDAAGAVNLATLAEAIAPGGEAAEIARRARARRPLPVLT